MTATDAQGAENGSDDIVFTVTRGQNPYPQIVINLSWTAAPPRTAPTSRST